MTTWQPLNHVAPPLDLPCIVCNAITELASDAMFSSKFNCWTEGDGEALNFEPTHFIMFPHNQPTDSKP